MSDRTCILLSSQVQFHQRLLARLPARTASLVLNSPVVRCFPNLQLEKTITFATTNTTDTCDTIETSTKLTGQARDPYNSKRAGKDHDHDNDPTTAGKEQTPGAFPAQTAVGHFHFL